MTKSYEKDKRFLENEKKQRISFLQYSPLSNTAVNNTNKNLESTSNNTCPSREQTLKVQTGYRKIDKIQKNWDSQPTKHLENRYNLDHQLTKIPPYQI